MTQTDHTRKMKTRSDLLDEYTNRFLDARSLAPAVIHALLSDFYAEVSLVEQDALLVAMGREHGFLTDEREAGRERACRLFYARHIQPLLEDSTRTEAA